MTSTEIKAYYVGVIARAIEYYDVQAEDARSAAGNWQDGEFSDRDDEALETEGACSVRERQRDGTWRTVPNSEWDSPASEGRADGEQKFVIHSDAEAAYWSSKSGWGDAATADVFSAAERVRLRLPGGGTWLPLKPYSVLLLYPDYISDEYGKETYYAFVEATDAIQAVAVAQRQAADAQIAEIDDPADFHPLLVTEGHHRGESLFNQ